MTAFRVATGADDGVIRALLRENGFPAWVEMAIEREPSFFAGAGLFGEDWAVIASEAREVVGMYTASVLPVHVDGVEQRLGYLGGLRVAPRHRRRIRHLREGYASIRELAQAKATLPWWFTAVSAGNRVARRLLESGRAGLPTYHPLGRYVTLALPAARGKAGRRWRRASESDARRIADFHNRTACQFQLSPSLSEDAVARIGAESFFVHEAGGRLLALAALWDQRPFKQVVARSYRKPIGALVPAYNALAAVLRRTPLPAEGQRLEHTFVAFLAMADAAAGDALPLVQELLSHCRTPVASLGLHASSELLPALRALAPIRYESCLYAVGFDSVPALGGLRVQPEAALL